MDRYRACKQCCYYEDNGRGFMACWAPEENWEKSEGQPTNLKVCGYKNLKFGEKHYTRAKTVVTGA